VHLAHGVERVRHCVSFDGVLEGVQSPITVSLSKDLEGRHRVIPVSQVGVNVVHDAECVPTFPMVAHGIGLLRGNTGYDAFMNNAEVKAERIGLRSWQSWQGQL
jgi:hypothetical protein